MIHLYLNQKLKRPLLKNLCDVWNVNLFCCLEKLTNYWWNICLSLKAYDNEALFLLIFIFLKTSPKLNSWIWNGISARRYLLKSIHLFFTRTSKIDLSLKMFLFCSFFEIICFTCFPCCVSMLYSPYLKWLLI